MAEPENHTLTLLLEIRDEQKAQRSILEDVVHKLEKQNVELVGVRGRVRKIEETLEDMANILERHSVV
jgi:chloramphenicol 3-O-phosphotransferase